MDQQPYVEDSLKKRYFSKLGAKFVGIPIAFLTAAIVPRGLGVNAYGNYNFITDFFMKLTANFDIGTSTYFYNKLSQRPNESSLIRFYLGFVVIMSLLMVLFVASLFIINKQGIIFIGQEPRFVWLGLFWGLLYWFYQIVYKIVDAYGLTVKGEFAIVGKQLIGLCLLGLLFTLGKFSLSIFFTYHFFMFILMLFFWWKILRKNNIRLFPSERLNKTLIKSYSREFYEFSMPLFIGGIFTFFLAFADRWMLQLFGGSKEQGLYSLAFKVGSLCFLFTRSMTPLFQREISRAYGENNIDEMGRLFLRFVPMLYSVAACIATFFFFQSDKVSLLVGGESFKGASVSLALMSLYPIHQTYGQLNSAVYFASGRTKLYRNIGLSMTLFGLLVTYLFLAPKEQWGLNLGSMGLALKMVLITIIGQNILLWFNTKLLKISFIKLLGHQFKAVIIIGGAAGLATLISDYIIGNIVLSLITAGLIYMILLMGILYWFPSLFSTNRSEIIQNVRLVKQRLIGLNKLWK
jgi:O-antigen/teichoic acid export membrane protein